MCDNFLIEPFDKKKICITRTSTPNFTVCLADWGNTEWIKYRVSPEMLQVAYAGNVERETYDRRKHAGAGVPLVIYGHSVAYFLTGEWLFYDTDWVRFFIRLTQKHDSTDDDLITQMKRKRGEKKEKLEQLRRFPARCTSHPSLSTTYQHLTLRTHQR